MTTWTPLLCPKLVNIQVFSLPQQKTDTDSPIVSEPYYHPRDFSMQHQRLGQVHVFGTHGSGPGSSGPVCSGPLHGVGILVFG